jgi:iron complex transport system substrate-binding protein
MNIKAGKAKLFNLICFLFVLSAISWALSGCQKSDGETAGEQVESTAQNRPVQAKATKPGGVPTTEVVVSEQMPGKPRRIVSLAPNVTEILYELGAGDRVVAVTRFCDFPPEARDRPKIGGIIDPDLEAIVSKDPDLVIGVTSGADASIREQLDSAGVAYAFAEMDDIDETYAGILHIGTWLGEDRRARELVDDMKTGMEAASVDMPADERPSVLFVYGRNPLTVAGSGTFGHELLRRAGGRNPMADADVKYPKVDVEKVLEINPDRIIDATMGSSVKEDYWQQYEDLEAVASGHVYRLEDNALLRPGPRLVEGLERVREAVRGESSAGEPDQ